MAHLARRNAEAEFDEETVLAEMAVALDEDADDLEIDSSPLESFGEGDAFTVSLGRYTEYTVVPDDDTAENIAIAVVTQDLESEPEIFTPSFIESHIDMDALKKWVWDAVMEDDYADEIASDDPERFWEELAMYDSDLVPEFEEDEDGDEIVPDPEPKDIEALREAIADDRAEDPMGWLEDIYGAEDARKQAIEAVGIDIAAAANEAVRVDGWQHFLARYDGNSYETESGFVYWRDN